MKTIHEVKLMMIDPKMSWMYNGIPHLLTPVGNELLVKPLKLQKGCYEMGKLPNA